MMCALPQLLLACGVQLPGSQSVDQLSPSALVLLGVVFRPSGLVAGAYLPMRYLAGLFMFSLCWD